MGGNLCANEEPLSTHSIVENLYHQYNDLLHIELGRERMEYIEAYNIKQHKHQNLNKYYFGRFVNGKADGHGIFYVPQHQCYQGSFSNGLPSGFGLLTFLNRKERYEGQFDKGVAHGKGKLVNECGNVQFTFEGVWKNSEPVLGRLTPQFGSTVEYMQLNNEDKNNQLIQFANGDTYKGALNAYFQPHGQGTHTFNANSPMIYFKGEWKKGCFEGKGICEWRDGSHYEGEFAHGVKKGQGKYTYPSGKYYEGFWINGLPHGIGSLFNSSGKLESSGVWVEGNIIVRIEEAMKQILECQRLPVMKEEQIRIKNTRTSFLNKESELV